MSSGNLEILTSIYYGTPCTKHDKFSLQQVITIKIYRLFSTNQLQTWCLAIIFFKLARLEYVI